jgi:fatty-acyl-CoA synthase
MIGSLLKINAERDPGAIAVVFGPIRLSYAALNERANRLANGFAALGVGRGDRIASLMNNCHHVIEIFFAAAKLGAIFVPINFRLAPREVSTVMEACKPKALVAGTALGPTLSVLEPGSALPEHVLSAVDQLTDPADASNGDYESFLARQSAQEPNVSVADEGVLLLLHSSGTTGQPKTAIWTHRTTLSSSMAKIIDFALTPEDRTAVFGPLSHVGPLMDLAVPLLLRGGALVIGPTTGFDPAQMLATLAREKITVVTIYPTMWRRVLALEAVESYDLSRLRLLFTGGEPIPIPVLRGVYERFPCAGFVNTYGSTEGGPITTFLSPADSVRKIGSIGRPAFSVDVRIVGDNDSALGTGEVGELVVRSPFVCAGYWEQPEETRLQLRNGWWHTGDLAWRDEDGYLWIAGRKKDMIISGAENIYPIEIEQTIAELDDVMETAVVGVADEQWGEAVVAFIVTKPGSPLDETRVIEHCRLNLASYKKPRKVIFLERLPRTAVSKISKEALRQLAADHQFN